MPTYRVQFVDEGDNLYDVVNVEHDEDEAAVEHAHRINVPSIGGGFRGLAEPPARPQAPKLMKRVP